MHYPMVEWPKSRHGSVHLHGHQHNKSDYNERMRKEGIKRYDVGVDANDFKPVSINEILNFIYKNNEPLYKVNDEITFKYKGKKTEGIVYIVDKYHFGYYDPTYDILLKDENKQLLLMKHVLEKYIKLFEGNNTQFERDLYFIKEEFNKLTKEPSL